MSDFYAAIAPDGTRALASHDGEKRVRFNDEPWIAMPTHGNALAVAPDGSRLLVRGRNDRVYRVSRAGVVTDLDSAAGTHSVGFNPIGREYWIRSTREYVADGLVLPVPRDAHGQYISGQGWTQIRTDGPAWTDRIGTRVIDGRTLTRCTDVPGFGVVGMDTKVERILAYRTADRAWWIVWTGHTDIGPCAAMVNGRVVVAIGPPGIFVPESQWTRTTLTTPPPLHDNPNGTPMTSAEYIDLRDRLKRIDAMLHAHGEALGAHDVKLSRILDALDEWPDQPTDPTPGPPDADAPVIDLSSVVWLHTDVSGWAETSRIDHVGIEWPKAGDSDNGQVCFPHTKAGQWPTFDNGSGEGNVWVFGRINGQWYAATAEWLKPGQTCKRFSNRTEPDSWGIGPHTKKDPLKSWGPQSGEWIGIMVSTRARDGQRSVDDNGQPVLERSNVAMVRWT